MQKHHAQSTMGGKNAEKLFKNNATDKPGTSKILFYSSREVQSF